MNSRPKHRLDATTLITLAVTFPCLWLGVGLVGGIWIRLDMLSFVFGVGSAVMFLYAGLWIVWPLLLVFFVLQMAFEGGLRLIWWVLRRSWRALRGLPPPPPQVIASRPPESWLKSYALLFGFAVGGTWAVTASGLDGSLSHIGSLL